jgi:hypothetical protein
MAGTDETKPYIYMTKLCEPYLTGMKTYTGRGGIAPLILNFGNKVRFALDNNPGHFISRRRGPITH